MSEIVVSTWVVGAELGNTLDIIQELGLHLLELLASVAVHDQDLRDEHVVAEVWDMTTARGQQVYSVHNAFGPEWCLATPQADQRKLALANHTALLRAAGTLDSEHAVIHAGELHPGEPAPAQLERFLLGLQELLPVAQEAGVLIAVENLPPDHLGSSLEQMRWVLDRLDPDLVGFCCDTGHAQLAGTPPATWIRELGDRLIGVHLQDTNGHNDAHLFPGTGRIDWEEFFASLRELDYRLPLTLEAFPPADMPWAEAARIAERAVGELQPPRLPGWVGEG